MSNTESKATKFREGDVVRVGAEECAVVYVDHAERQAGAA